MKPILMSTEMVTAILEGRKTETRRIAMSDKPPYEMGDILYVRETWNVLNMNLVVNITGKKTPVSIGTKKYYYFEATTDSVMAKEVKWRPSIHMPKEAARLFLLVYKVEKARLWDITEAGVKREGFVRTLYEDYAIHRFIDFWNSKYSGAKAWERNPYVWVIHFEPREKKGSIDEEIENKVQTLRQEAQGKG